uniref:Uncharacterized protein n=1 Tax=Panagrolaimus sp. JU765 TaxID=591449 RepID=A0AC34RJ53_9BILA
MIEKTDNEKQQERSQSPKSAITSSSSSNDLGFGDEVSDGFESIDYLQSLKSALQQNFSFIENINMGNSLCGRRISESSESSIDQLPPPLSPAKLIFPKTKIPELKFMSKSFCNSHLMTLDEDYESSFQLLSRSVNDGSFSAMAIGSHYGCAHGSREQLAERELDLKEDSRQLLQKCRQRKKMSENYRFYPQRAITRPLRSYDSIGEIKRILTPEHEIDAVLRPRETFSTIQDYIDEITNFGEELKKLDEQLLSPTRKPCQTKKERKSFANLERNPDLDRYMNACGGKITPVEQRLALYRNPKTKCTCCRWISLLHRIHQKSCPLKRKSKARIWKNNVVRRDRCVCESCKNSKEMVIKTKTVCFLDRSPFCFMVYFGILAIFVQIIQLLSCN